MKVDLVDLGVVKIRRGRYSDARAIQALFSQAPYVGNGDSSGYQLEDVRAYIRRDLVLVAVSAEKRIVGALWDILYPRHLIAVRRQETASTEVVGESHAIGARRATVAIIDVRRARG